MGRLAFRTAVILAGSLLLCSADRAAASVSVAVSVNFYDSLRPYGDWVEHGRFGIVWAPRRVHHGWRPYTQGHWIYTDYDWTWVSDEDWGWATDHYGRWYDDPAEGWIWIPGEQWAPAWVAWRHGGGYVGWAPLPPEIDVLAGSFDVRIDPFAYSFVEERRLCEPAVYRYFAPPARNVTYVSITQNVTNYTIVGDRVVNRGVDIVRVERVLGRAVPRVQLREVASARDALGGHVRAGQVAVFRPAAAALRTKAEPHALVRREDVDRPERLVRHQEQERHQLESAERHERTELRRIQEREQKHPPTVIEEHEKRTTLDREQVHARHQAEQKAQAEHEQRERQALDHRHERERQAAQPHQKASPEPKHDRH